MVLPLLGLAAASVAGGLISSVGASKAAKTQAKSTDAAAELQYQSAQDTNALQKKMFDQNLAFQKQAYNQNVARQQPWLQAGKGALDRLMPMGNPGAIPTFNPTGFEESPGYQYRLDQGQKALEAASSARGMRMSGNALKDAMYHNQGMASQEYGNWWNRESDLYNAKINKSNMLYNRNAAIAGVGQTATNNLQTSGQNFSNALASAGQNYANSVGNTNMSAANNAGNALMAGGAARASGYQGVANAFNNTLGGFGSVLGMAQGGYLGANPGFGITPTHNPYSGAAY